MEGNGGSGEVGIRGGERLRSRAGHGVPAMFSAGPDVFRFPAGAGLRRNGRHVKRKFRRRRGFSRLVARRRGAD